MRPNFRKPNAFGYNIQNDIKGVQKALQSGRLTIPEIADLFEVSEEFVRKEQKGEA